MSDVVVEAFGVEEDVVVLSRVSVVFCWLRDG